MKLEDLGSLRDKFEEEGYIIVDLELPKSLTDAAIDDTVRINRSESRRLNPDIYHYNESPRLIEGWKQSESIKAISLDERVLLLLKALFTKEPIPFSTINFTRGTEQPLHSDYYHFGSMPELMLAGVWVALEDIHPDSGPLDVVPKSNHSPIVLPEDLGVKKLPKKLQEIKENYSLYESWVRKYVQKHAMEVRTPLLKRGQALIWAANTFHGAGEIKNKELTRFSQVTHYHFEDCEFFYNPNFSSRKHYVRRDVEASRIY